MSGDITISGLAGKPKHYTPPERKKTCHTSLVLLMDESGSVKYPNWKLQLKATGEALTSDRVMDIIHDKGPVAIKVMAFNNDNRSLSDWRLIQSQEDMDALVKEFLSEGKAYKKGGTAIGEALKAAADALNSSERAKICPGSRGVIDISTDGQNTVGPEPHEGRDYAALAPNWFTVNAIGVGPKSSPDSLRKNVKSQHGRVFEAETMQK